jgi:hypothetical protein
MSMKRNPMANNLDGDPIELPLEAVAWRVRRRSGKQGRPQCVYDRETGAQLEIPIEATLDDLRDYGPGVYRLDAVDAEGRVIPGIVAQTEVPIEEERPDPGPSDAVTALREVLGLLRHSVDTNCRAIEAMATAFGPIKPAVQHPVVVSGPEKEPPSIQEQIQLFAGVAQQFMSMLNQAKEAGVKP